MKLGALILLIIGCSFQTCAQEKNEVWLEGKFKAGFLAAHRAIMGHLPTEHAFAGELSYVIQSKGKKYWHEQYKYPTYGVTGFFGSAGNRELLGHYFGAYGFMNFPLIKTKHYSFNFKTGAGIGYGTKVYDSETNPLSMALSTHLNSLVVLGVESRFRFGNHTATLGLDMTHFSNGATKVPNLGLNLPYVSIGYGHRIQRSTFCDTCARISLLYMRKRWEFGGTAIGSVKEIFPVGSGKYGVYALSALGRHYFNPKVGMEVSLDAISNQSIRGYLPDISKTQWEILQFGLFTGYILPLDHFQLMVGMGAYLKNKYGIDGRFYHRLGFRYVFDNGINAQIMLKSHWARADYIEYGIGYTIGW